MADSFYRFGRALLNETTQLYYRRIETVGRDRIPARGPAIREASATLFPELRFAW